MGVKVTQVPYRGAGPALVDLLAGQVDLGPISAVVAQPLVKSGKLKAYAIIGRTRFAGLPDLPTMLELGYKKLDIDFWHMLLAPAGTPRPIVDKLNAALRTALADPKVQKTYADGGMDEYPANQETPEAAAALAQARDQTLGRGDPRQPPRDAVAHAFPGRSAAKSAFTRVFDALWRSGVVRCRTGIVTSAESATIPDQRCTASRCTASGKRMPHRTNL